MEPSKHFQNKPKSFWACVRTISQHVGYSQKGKSIVLTPRVSQMAEAFAALELDVGKIVSKGKPTSLAQDLEAYFELRAKLLNDYARPRLMTAEEAKKLFKQQKSALKPTCPIPMNKQKGLKRAPAYLTGLVNMIVEANTVGCDFDPRELTTVTRDGLPLRTLARRVDGAFPSVVNPVAVWEIKEYYYSTTFGSRVAGGVYESLLDGLELEELRTSENVDVKHYLMIDAYRTWWDQGKSYLCRIVDALHMGYIDEVFFGREVVERLPMVAKSWKSKP